MVYYIYIFIELYLFYYVLLGCRSVCNVIAYSLLTELRMGGDRVRPNKVSLFMSTRVC